MEPLLNEFTRFPWLPIQTAAARMIAALLFGALVGFEREWRNHPAGLRTHMLVCLASACVAILAIEIAHMPPFDNESTRIDPLRLIEAVTGGVAFLAAGFIVFTNGRVRGLTTGAGMWLAGAIGLACGLGALHIAALATVLAILVLWILGHVEKSMGDSDDPDGKYES
ncbi:MgtC/SapB family protein [Amaricoccus tamworthensis]|uniref:MgtC/SapB family protein n=1 Tax=Amaricoccus tamworthensis TaxID=57002 RepID=UPI003C7B31A2